MAVNNVPAGNFLWKYRLKINTPDGGLVTTLWFPNKNQVDAEAAAVDISARMKCLMPSTTEIFSASIHRQNGKRDGFFMPNLLGPGTYVTPGVDPPPSTYNRFDDAILVRMEDAEGVWVSVPIGPVPDNIIQNQEIPIAIAGVGAQIAPPAAIVNNPVVYNVEFTKLMAALVFYCGHVVAKTNINGGAYDFTTFVRANVKRVTKKKGGRVFLK